MSENKTAYLVPKFTTVRPVFNLPNVFSVAWMREDGEHPYLSFAVGDRVLEIHFIGKRQFKAFE